MNQQTTTQADDVLPVVDATVGATDTDEQVVKVLRRGGKPVVHVANKVDDQRSEADAAMLWSLGLGQPWPVSALHGRGSGDVLDAVLEVLPKVSGVAGAYRRGGPRRVALLGRPNVGKSSLINRLAGAVKAKAADKPGVTRAEQWIKIGAALDLLDQHCFGRLPDQGRNSCYVFFVGFSDLPLHLFRGD